MSRRAPRPGGSCPRDGCARRRAPPARPPLAPWSPPIASTATRTPRAGSVARPRMARSSTWPSVSSLGGRLLAGRAGRGLRLDRDRPAVAAAVRAGAVRELGFVAVRARLEAAGGSRAWWLRRSHLARVRHLALRHSHVGLVLLSVSGAAHGRPRSGSWFRSGRAAAASPGAGRSRSLPGLGRRRRPGTPGVPPGGGRRRRSAWSWPGVQALAALRAQSGAVRLAQRRDRLGQAGSLRGGAVEQSSSWWPVRRAISGSSPSSSRTGMPELRSMRRQGLFVDDDLHGRDDRPQAATALAGQRRGQRRRRRAGRGSSG